jgi:hypothetical protein
MFFARQGLSDSGFQPWETSNIDFGGLPVAELEGLQASTVF